MDAKDVRIIGVGIMWTVSVFRSGRWVIVRTTDDLMNDALPTARLYGW